MWIWRPTGGGSQLNLHRVEVGGGREVQVSFERDPPHDQAHPRKDSKPWAFGTGQTSTVPTSYMHGQEVHASVTCVGFTNDPNSLFCRKATRLVSPCGKKTTTRRTVKQRGSFSRRKMDASSAAEADTHQHGTQPHNASHNPSEDHWSIVLKKLGAHSDASAEAASDAPCVLTSILHNRILHNVTFLMQRLLATTKLHSGSRSSSARLSSR